MQRLTSAMRGLILGAALVLAGALPAGAQTALEGQLGRDQGGDQRRGEPRGHRTPAVGFRRPLRDQVQGRQDRLRGHVRTEPKATPAAIDFAHTLGALNGKAWKGIYKLDGDTLTICDNAADLAKGRPTAFASKSGSGYVLLTFAKAK